MWSLFTVLEDYLQCIAMTMLNGPDVAYTIMIQLKLFFHLLCNGSRQKLKQVIGGRGMRFVWKIWHCCVH